MLFWTADITSPVQNTNLKLNTVDSSLLDLPGSKNFVRITKSLL